MSRALSRVAVSAGAPRTRDRNRRDKILRAACRLFRERGFHAVGIDEIGEAAGITGPGVYRHFSGKDELLVCALEDAAEQLWRDLDVEHGSPTLEDYVRSHASYSLDNADAIELWYRERRNLPPEADAAQRRVQRRYLEGLVVLLRQRRPELDAGEARARVQAVFALLHSAAQSSHLVERDRLAVALEQMALAALMA